MSVNLKIEEIRELLNNNLSDEIDELLDDIRILSDAKDSALKTSNKPALNIIDVSISFTDKFDKYEDAYTLFLMWCMDNNGHMTKNEWATKKSIEFKRLGLDTFFNEC